MAYTIGSDKGIKIANSMAAGETYKAADGSTWKKNSDGSVSVTTKSGNTSTANIKSSSGSTGTIGAAAGAVVGNTGNKSTYSPTFNGSATTVGTYTDPQDAIKAQMNANSIAWHTASPEEQARLHAENQALAAQLGSGVGFNSSTGSWSGNADMPRQTAPSFTWDTAAPTYTGKYDAQIDSLLSQILNRDKFSYDVETDPLYQQYAAMYNREGNRAMNDTLASAAANAGGMNSYALTAAQQANNYYAAQLSDRIPELYQLAYDMYLSDIDNQVRDLGLLQNMDDTQYSRYRDTMSDWRDDRNFAYNQYRDDMSDYQWGQNFDYNAAADQRDYDYNTSYTEKEDAYNKAMTWLSQGKMPDSATLAAAGISETEASAYIAAINAASVKSGDVPIDEKKDVKIEDDVTPKDEGNAGEDDLWSNINALGLGPVSASLVEELYDYGGILENADGSFSWASGWNAQNYEAKLAEAKQNSFVLGSGYLSELYNK